VSRASAPLNARSRRYPPAQKQALLAAYASSGATMVDFCAQHGITTASLCTWRRRQKAEGDAGLAARANARNARGPHRGAYPPEQRRAAVEAFLASGQTLQDFARIWGVSRKIFGIWVKRYRTDGPQALEPRRRGRPRRIDAELAPDAVVGRRLAAPIRDLIARTKQRFPTFGLKKVAQFLFRFHAVKVSTGGVKRALVDAGLPPPAPVRKVRRAPPAVRRFERAKAMELWQSDITSFLVGRHRERAYLTVFLDDYSRFVVSFALHLQQKSELVLEALKDGIARFGKPREILTDQGRQYFSWRGKSEFQHLLHREVIRHVVARSHHPQTVGKCERLWETVKSELLDRVDLEDLADARTRLAHFFAHYNHFRPHQGIDGLTPADRFFGVEDALRRMLEQQISKHELALALHAKPPPAVYLFGQIGDEQVALHGERGRVVIQTSGGGPRELDAERVELSSVRAPVLARAVAPVNAPPNSLPSTPTSEIRDERPLVVERARVGTDVVAGSNVAPDAPLAQARALSDRAEDAAAGACAVGSGEQRGEDGGAPHVQRDAAALAGGSLEGAGGARAQDPAATRVATEPTGARGDGGGTLEATARATERRDADAAEPRRGPEVAQGEGEGARAQAQARGGRDRAPAADAGAGEATRGEGRDAEGGGPDGGTEGGQTERPGASGDALRDAQTESTPESERRSGTG
jgi:transposase InsO family protein